jgi:hypothetical protein
MSVRLTVSWKVEGYEDSGLSYTVTVGAPPPKAEERLAPPLSAVELLPLTSSVIYPGLSIQIAR